MSRGGPRICGGCLKTDSAAVSADGELIFVSSAAAIRVYSSLTGARVHDLHGHAAEVTAVCVDPAHQQQIYSCAMDCTMRKWDVAEKECLSLIKLEAPVVNMVMAGPDLVVVALESRGGDGGRVGTYCLKAKRWSPLLRLSSPSRVLSLSPSKQYVATFERHTLHIVEIAKTESQGAKLKLTHTKPFSCVAFDCTNHHIAAGDSSGRINIWTGIEQAAEDHRAGKPTDPRTAGMRQQTLHWHSNEVQSLCFSPDGCYLLSGGHEAVLVIWQLATLTKQFLTRLGGGICHISPFPNDPTQYVLGFDTNVIRCVSIAEMKVTMSSYGLRPSPVGAPSELANKGITIQPGSGFLALPCVSSQLQLYDCVRDCHVARVQVSKRNTYSFNDEQNPYTSSGQHWEPAMELAAFTHEGETLVTVESMPCESTSSVARWHSLKFWDVHVAGSGQTEYRVNSVVNDPHFGHITSVACHPHEVMVATTCMLQSGGAAKGGSEGVSGQPRGSFRLWRKRHFKRPPGAAADAPTWHWHSTHVNSYKDAPMHSCAFSHDGSMLAVGGATCTTLWGYGNKFIASLVWPFHDTQDSRVSHVCFVQGGPYMVTAHGGGKKKSHGLCVWNLLTLSLQWAFHATVYDLAAHPTGQRFACMFSRGGKRIVGEFEPAKGNVVRSWQGMGSDKPVRVLYAPAASALSACRLGNTPMLVVSQSRRVMVVGRRSHAPPPRSGGGPRGVEGWEADQHAAGDGILSEMFGVDAEDSPPGADIGAHVAVTQKERAAALQAALPLPADSHLLPPTPELCNRVLWALLGADNDAPL